MQPAHPSTMTSANWPPSCRSKLSSCTCCCILTPHTHLSDSAGYPHLNHIIRCPQPDTESEALAWFHCPHCPCMLGLTWVHPKDMPLVEKNVSAATWLPRMADFEGYAHLLEERPAATYMSPSCLSPMTDTTETPMEIVLGDRTNVPENTPSTPTTNRKPPINSPRKSGRKPKPAVQSDVQDESPVTTPTYKPRRSKYDIY
jgi:hypothetical protein